MNLGEIMEQSRLLPLSMKYVLSLEPVPWKRVGLNFPKKQFYDQQRQDKLIYGLELIKQHGKKPKLQGPISLEVIFYMPQASVHVRRKKDNMPQDYPHFYRPDLDNLGKFLTDAMSDTEVIFSDDCQIATTIMKKVYGN